MGIPIPIRRCLLGKWRPGVQQRRLPDAYHAQGGDNAESTSSISFDPLGPVITYVHM